MAANLDQCCAFGENCPTNDTVRLSDCLKDTNMHIRSHQANCKSFNDIRIPEACLILNRFGTFSFVHELESPFNKLICSYHRDRLGIYWKRPSRLCMHPLHGESKSRPDRGLTYLQSMELFLKRSKKVAVGSGICKRCSEKHKAEISLGNEFSEELRERILKINIDIMDNSSGKFPAKEVEASEDIHSESDNAMEVHTPCHNDSEVEASEDIHSESDNAMEVHTPCHNDSEVLGTDSESYNCSQATSTASDWIATTKSSRDIYNEAMQMLSHGEYEELKYQPSLPLNELQYKTRSYYIKHAKTAMLLVCESIAPGQAEDLLQEVFKRMKVPEPPPKDSFTEAVVEAYKKAENHTTQVMLLSLIVNSYTKSELKNMIDGLTIYKIDSARKHAQAHCPGSYITPPKITRIRISKGKIQHFIEFISAPIYLQTVGFGSKHLKLSSGLEVKVPKVIRTMIASRLIAAYSAYCQENDVMPPSKATLYKVVKACAASQLKSLQGLDNHQHEGNVAIQTLERVVDKLVEYGSDFGRGMELKKHINSLKLHLKHDFGTHLKEESNCIQHCIHHALSESPCQHNHTESCLPCSNIANIPNDVMDWISHATSDIQTLDQHLKDEIQHDIDQSVERIINWRNHIIRTINQDSCKSDFLSIIEEHQVLLIADWAMKYLPHTFREAQSEWFGKQGISWHITCALIKSDDPQEKFKILSFVHLLANGSQGWFSVSQILTHTVQMLKEKQPQLTEVYLRSDNAGCYHCIPLLTYLWKFRNDLELTVKEYNFSEAQSGKDLCDSRTGCCRLHILNHINEGHNVTNVQEMKAALDSHGGIRNTFCSIIDIDTSLQPTVSTYCKFPISQYNNFSFMDNGLFARKAYKIAGDLIPSQKLDVMTQNMTEVHLNDSFKILAHAVCPAEKARSKKGSIHLHPCCDPDCVKQFRKEHQLLQHVAVGQHVYDNEEGDTSLDTAKRLWAEKCTSLRTLQPNLHDIQTSPLETSTMVEGCGYALKSRKKSTRFSTKVKDYLFTIFTAGENSGKKLNPYTVAKMMRNDYDDEGNRMFLPPEWLTHQQIRGVFANFALKKQKEVQQQQHKVKRVKVEEVNEQDEDLEDVIEALVAAEHFEAVETLTKELSEQDFVNV